MKHLIQTLIRLDHHILYQRSGRPAEFAEKIGISERSLYDYLKLMKDLGAPLRYSKRARTYVYQKEGSFNVGFFSTRDLTNKEPE